MSTTRGPAHRHWKRSPPSSHAMDLIRQVNYDLEFDEDDNDGMLDVYEVNTLKPEDESRSHWRRFPAAYLTFLKRFLYRFELYLDVHDVVHAGSGGYSPSKDSIRRLKQYIQYMDGVIMEAWDQCREAAVQDELGPDWRCPALDRWLCLEFHIGRHGIEDVEAYIKTSGGGLDEDPFEFDWSEYERSVPEWHHGDGYDYDIGTMSEEDLRGMVPKVMSWLENKPDTSDEDDVEDVGSGGNDASDDEDAVINEADSEAGEEEVVKAKDKKAASKGKQAAPQKAKATSKGKVASAAPSEDKKKMSTSKSKGKKADTLAKGHAKSIADGNKARTKTETIVETEGLIVSSKRRPKPTRKVLLEDVKPEDDEEDESVIIIKKEKAGPSTKSNVRGNKGTSAAIGSRREIRRQLAASSGKNEGRSAGGTKRKDRGSLEIAAEPPARRSTRRNAPRGPDDSPSASTVPLPSISSTPAPSQNGDDTEEWGTGVPSGAFFGPGFGSQLPAVVDSNQEKK